MYSVLFPYYIELNRPKYHHFTNLCNGKSKKIAVIMLIISLRTSNDYRVGTLS